MFLWLGFGSLWQLNLNGLANNNLKFKLLALFASFNASVLVLISRTAPFAAWASTNTWGFFLTMLSCSCLCGGMDKNQSPSALVLNLLGRATTRREPRLKGFFAFRPYWSRSNAPCRGGYQQNLCAYWQDSAWTYYGYHRNRAIMVVWRLGEPNSSLWKSNIVLIGTVVGSIPMAELGEYHLIVLSYA